MKNKYTTPQLTVVEFRAEKGFATSPECMTCSTNYLGGIDPASIDKFLHGMEMSGNNANGGNTHITGINYGFMDVTNPSGGGGWFGESSF